MKRLLMILLMCAALPVAAQEVAEAAGVVEVVEVVEQAGPSRAELFRQADPYGLVMALLAMSVVFSSLVTLYLIFKGIGILFRKATTPRSVGVVEVAAPAMTADEVEGDVFAAIAIAMYQYSEDLHDVENTVLTINRGAKAYSPWSSKIYGLRRMPK